MNNFVFYSPTEFVFGKDTDIQTGTLAKKYNARKAMIVYGGGSIIRSGLLQRIYKPQNKMFHFCKTFCSKITLVNTIQNVILNPI